MKVIMENVNFDSKSNKEIHKFFKNLHNYNNTFEDFNKMLFEFKNFCEENFNLNTIIYVVLYDELNEFLVLSSISLNDNVKGENKIKIECIIYKEEKNQNSKQSYKVFSNEGYMFLIKLDCLQDNGEVRVKKDFLETFLENNYVKKRNYIILT